MFVPRKPRLNCLFFPSLHSLDSDFSVIWLFPYVLSHPSNSKFPNRTRLFLNKGKSSSEVAPARGNKELYLFPSTHVAKETSLSGCVRYACAFVVGLPVINEENDFSYSNASSVNLAWSSGLFYTHQVIFTFTLLQFSSTSPKKPNWCSRKACIYTQLLLHIPPISLREKLCIIYKENKCGWSYSSLSRTKHATKLTRILDKYRVP